MGKLYCIGMLVFAWSMKRRLMNIYQPGFWITGYKWFINLLWSDLISPFKQPMLEDHIFTSCTCARGEVIGCVLLFVCCLSSVVYGPKNSQIPNSTPDYQWKILCLKHGKPWKLTQLCSFLTNLQCELFKACVCVSIQQVLPPSTPRHIVIELAHMPILNQQWCYCSIV